MPSLGKAKSAAALFIVFIALLSAIVTSRVIPRHNHHKSAARCRSKCLPGWGLSTACTTTNPEPACAPCPPGHWTPHHQHTSQCRPCSLCGAGLYVERACARSRDTKCDSCDTSNGRLNDDFVLKCIDPLLQDGDQGPAVTVSPDGRHGQKSLLDHFIDTRYHTVGDEQQGKTTEDDSAKANIAQDHPAHSDDYVPKSSVDSPHAGSSDTKNQNSKSVDVTGDDAMRPIMYIKATLGDDKHQFREFDGDEIVTHSPIPKRPSYTYETIGDDDQPSLRLLAMLGLSLGALTAACAILLAIILKIWRRNSEQEFCAVKLADVPKMHRNQSSSDYNKLDDQLTESQKSIISHCADKLDSLSPKKPRRPPALSEDLLEPLISPAVIIQFNPDTETTRSALLHSPQNDTDDPPRSEC